MQMTADRDDKYLFRINGYDSYRDWMESKCLGSVKAPDVLAKVIFFNDSAEFISYCNSGKFPRTGGHSVVEGTDYSLRPMRPVPHDIYGRPLPRTAPWLKHWNSTPDVDRSQIKICRFDYFGHSDSSEMMLEYGWSNQKGEVPVSDVGLSDLELFASFPPSVLTADAHAALWGCYLGESGGIGPGLAKRFRGGVCAADVRTDFSQIVVNDTEMPYPVKDEWNAAGVHRRSRGEFKKFPYAAAASAP
ncbi:MAG: hypothetical protein H7X97_05005 [Opitutaceae bacterium]|nr:hypothetical protein [Verrucomicrobiales bacterium]